MNIRRQFTINELPDPFTLLEVCQALREIPCGDALEIICEGDMVPDELFKVLPPEEYEIAERRLHENPRHCRIVIRKKKGPAPGPDHPKGGWCCS